MGSNRIMNCGFHGPPTCRISSPIFSLSHLLFICNLPVRSRDFLCSSHWLLTQLHRLKPLSPDTRSPTQFNTSTWKRQFVTMPTILYVTVAAKQSHIPAKEYSVLQIINKRPRPESELILNSSDDFHTQSDNELKSYLTRCLRGNN